VLVVAAASAGGARGHVTVVGRLRLVDVVDDLHIVVRRGGAQSLL